MEKTEISYEGWVSDKDLPEGRWYFECSPYYKSGMSSSVYYNNPTVKDAVEWLEKIELQGHFFLEQFKIHKKERSIECIMGS